MAPKAPQTEWSRKTHSPIYIQRAKATAEMIRGFVNRSRSPVRGAEVSDATGQMVPVDGRVTHRDITALVHEVLDEMTFERRRRDRSDSGNPSAGTTAVRALLS